MLSKKQRESNGGCIVMMMLAAGCFYIFIQMVKLALWCIDKGV